MVARAERARENRKILATSCSCRLIVLVETTVRSPFSRAHTSAGTKIGERLPHPVPLRGRPTPPSL